MAVATIYLSQGARTAGSNAWRRDRSASAATRTAAARGTVETEAETTLSFDVEGLAAGADYVFWMEETAVRATTDDRGNVRVELTVPPGPDDGTGLVVERVAAGRYPLGDAARQNLPTAEGLSDASV